MDAFLMNSVLETGVGAPIVLAIIFRAVCHRAGVRVHLAVLDGGSDCVVWPEVCMLHAHCSQLAFGCRCRLRFLVVEWLDCALLNKFIEAQGTAY